MKKILFLIFMLLSPTLLAIKGIDQCKDCGEKLLGNYRSQEIKKCNKKGKERVKCLICKENVCKDCALTHRIKCEGYRTKRSTSHDSLPQERAPKRRKVELRKKLTREEEVIEISDDERTEECECEEKEEETEERTKEEEKEEEVEETEEVSASESTEECECESEQEQEEPEQKQEELVPARNSIREIRRSFRFRLIQREVLFHIVNHPDHEDPFTAQSFAHLFE